MKSLRLLASVLLAAITTRADDALPGTELLTATGDLSRQMHEAALRDMDLKIEESLKTREQFWHRDLSSPEAYEKSIAPNREHFRQILGVVEPRVPPAMERFGEMKEHSDDDPALVAETSRFRIYQVRWPVVAGVTGEGLLLEQRLGSAFVVALPDADQTPEQFAGLAPGVKPEAQLARRLAQMGYNVLVPTLIDRSDRGSGDPALLMTNLPHREWIHRQAFMMGRTLIGYEVQKVLAGIDWWYRSRNSIGSPAQVNVAGYGEGGLIALYAAALDPRISNTLVSGYFKSRQQTWQEPLYRDVWGLLREFGDAEIASLIGPYRRLVINYCDEPKIDGPPPAQAGQKDMAAPGRLTTPPFEEVETEFKRVATLMPQMDEHGFELVRNDDTAALKSFGIRGFGITEGSEEWSVLVKSMDTDEYFSDKRGSHEPFDTTPRQLRQVRELNDHIQLLVRDSDRTRDAFFLHKVLPEFANVPWNYNLSFPQKSPDAFVAAAKEYRGTFWQEILGQLDDPLPPPNPRTRLIYDEPKWIGYEVELDTGGEGFAWGVLLLPKDIKPGERRPVVVCQHGRHGIPSDVIKGDKPAYHNFAARLAEQGFITLAPHNLYQKEEDYRTLARKAHTVKATHWSVILRHHQQWLAWLASLPQVDPQRIGFYGLSFGGESAMRLPSLLDGYVLSICSGDFNDWTRKVASTHDRKSFMFTDEWEIACFNMGNTFSYAELSYLMFPRPFMVERGHHDGVSVDSWVASEYAKTRWLYDQFGMGDRTSIEFFNGGHTINGQGTFDFLHEHLHWPKPKAQP